ncbi:MAG: Kef family K(+) transporter [Rhizobiales bacterium]|nr:Kef family K(+) transporter [Hyphomicrobiales bacterium]
MDRSGTLVTHATPLISMIVIGLALAFILGVVANRLRISPLVGYLLAGIVIGPHTPGFVGDAHLAGELAELGVILLMFGVGLHFSFKELLSVRAIAIPGALVQIAVATLLGMGLAKVLGWPVQAGLVFGLALSVASTVVLLRALQERHLLNSERGRIAVGWLIVEDLVMVLTLVLLPAVAPLFTSGEKVSLGSLAVEFAMTVAKVAVFVIVMLVVGRRVIPAILHYVAHTASRELFRLAVLTLSLGVAFAAAHVFDVSFALGAFFAGMILSESELSQRAAQETLPLRDAFAVLFFVSVGMLFNPWVLIDSPAPLLATIAIIIIGKSAAAFAIVRLFGHPNETAAMISASLAQIGEFSFILVGLGIALGLMPTEGRDLVLAGALISIMLNPVCFLLADRLMREPKPVTAQPPAPEPEMPRAPAAKPIILVGFGRVGSAVLSALNRDEADVTIIEEREEAMADLAGRPGITTIQGNAVEGDLLTQANIANAGWLLVTAPDAFEAGQIVAQAKTMNPAISVVARAHSDAEVEHLKHYGADHVIMGEREIADAMVHAMATTSHG